MNNRFKLILLLFISVQCFVQPALVQGEQGPGQNKPAKGPNGGKLLRDGNVTLELAIFERGVPPEYRAWISLDGQPTNEGELAVTLNRLGGQQNLFTFYKTKDYWRAEGVVGEPHSFDVSVELTLKGKTYRWQWESYEGRVEIAPEIAIKAGINTVSAGPGNVERHIQVYGRLVTPADQTAQIRARFPGIVTEVLVNVGDRVQKGDVLALVESNQSLQTYELKAPFKAMVQTRVANIGEITGDGPLFTLINNDRLWAELKIFPSQRFEVKTGQDVHTHHGKHIHEGIIANMTPASQGKPYVMARVVLHNPNIEMAPGDLVSANIDAEKIAVPLVVDNRALQSFRDWQVVFIQIGNTYEIRPLELGRRDDRYTEVIKGLKLGDSYVVENSYLIKADILKSGASHDH